MLAGGEASLFRAEAFPYPLLKRSQERFRPEQQAAVLEHGRLLLSSEPLLAAFQGWVAEAIR